MYKMPILYSFYNHGNIRLAVTDEEVLESWKEFFDTGTNWKDFPNVNTYEDYKKVTEMHYMSPTYGILELSFGERRRD